MSLIVADVPAALTRGPPPRVTIHRQDATTRHPWLRALGLQPDSHNSTYTVVLAVYEG